MATRASSLTHQAHDAKTTHYNLQLQHKFTVSTGWLDQERFNLLADFFLAEKKFIIHKHQLIPIIVTSKKICQRSDPSALLAQTFEYQYDFTDSYYTEEAAV